MCLLACCHLLWRGGGGGELEVEEREVPYFNIFYYNGCVLGMQVYGMHLLDGVGLIELLACRNE